MGENKPTGLSFREGDDVFVETPYSTAVFDARLGDTCSWCFNIGFPYKIPCSTCSRATYCSNKCKQKDSAHHRFECLFLRFPRDDPMDFKRVVLRTVARVLQEQESGEQSVQYFFEHRRTYDDLLTHKNDFQPERMKDFNDLAEDLELFLAEHGHTVSKELIMDATLKLIINAHTVKNFVSFWEPQLGQGLYLAASKSDHTCEFKSEYVEVFRGNRFVVKATENFSVKDSLEVKVHYVSLDYGYEMRQEILRNRYYFTCKCQRCIKESKRSPSQPERLLENLVSTECTPEVLHHLRRLETLVTALPFDKLLTSKLFTRIFLTEQRQNIKRSHYLGYTAFQRCPSTYHKMKILYLLSVDLAHFGANLSGHEYHEKFREYHDMSLNFFTKIHGVDHELVKKMKVLDATFRCQQFMNAAAEVPMSGPRGTHLSNEIGQTV